MPHVRSSEAPHQNVETTNPYRAGPDPGPGQADGTPDLSAIEIAGYLSVGCGGIFLAAAAPGVLTNILLAVGTVLAALVVFALVVAYPMLALFALLGISSGFGDDC